MTVAPFFDSHSETLPARADHAASPLADRPSTKPAEPAEGPSFESLFRDPQSAFEQPLAWALNQQMGAMEALRGLFSGPTALVQLRLWCFMELATQPQGKLTREDLHRVFHALLPEALDNALKRLRDLDLLVWDATAQDYHLSPLALQVHALLAPLTTPPAAEHDDMAALLAQVAGAQQLGLVNANQLKHLHAQLARLHDDFAEAIASGSEARLRAAQPRFDRALALVDRAGQALTALIRADHEDPRLEREARAIGQAQARLLAMASQFTRALQQADRQRVTLGSTGLTTSDVRAWLQRRPALHELLDAALSVPVRPVMVSQHDLIDVAEGEFERDRPNATKSTGLPPPAEAAPGALDTLSLPAELGQFVALLGRWSERAGDASAAASDSAPTSSTDGSALPPGAKPVSEAILGGRFAQAAYRLQLLPLVGDAQAQTLKGLTGDLARAPWHWQLSSRHIQTDDEAVVLMSEGALWPAQAGAAAGPAALDAGRRAMAPTETPSADGSAAPDTNRRRPRRGASPATNPAQA